MPVYSWRVTSDTWLLHPSSLSAPPTKHQTATVSAVMLLSYAADVLLSGCLRWHFPLSSTNHVAPFRGTRGCRWDEEEKLKIASLHSFFLFTACRGGEGGDFFWCCSLQVNGGCFQDKLFPIMNQCALRHVTFSGLLLPSGCVTLMSISKNTLVKNKSYYEMVKLSKQMLKWRLKLLTRHMDLILAGEAWHNRHHRWEFSQGNKCRDVQTPNVKL